MSQRIFLPEHVRELDRIAIEEHGIAGYELMCRAGQAAFAAGLAHFPNARRWLILCGSGNNAGDGYVIGRLALTGGIDVQLLSLIDPGRLAGDAARAWQDFTLAGGTVDRWNGHALPEADLIVDALLGTGLARSLDGEYRDAVERINEHAAPALAVDTPTGLDASQGHVLGAAVRADLTVTFVGLKSGFYLDQGPAHVGRLEYSDLDIPADLAQGLPAVMQGFHAAEAREFLRPRSRDTHKVDNGHVLIIGGNRGMGGAARLAGEAALRAGAGLVTVATHPDNVHALVAGRPELMAHPVQHANELEPLLKRAHVVAIGPGLGGDAWARELWLRARDIQLPMIVDADALNWLAKEPRKNDQWVLTPHPGEAGRLLDCSSAAVQTDRLAALSDLVERYGGVALLKGAGTLISAPEVPWVLQAGNPGMATAGMGDVLTGICAAIVAQNRRQLGAADSTAVLSAIVATAAWAHASAADLQVQRHGERGLIASDIFSEVRRVLNPCA